MKSCASCCDDALAYDWLMVLHGIFGPVAYRSCPFMSFVYRWLWTCLWGFEASQVGHDGALHSCIAGSWHMDHFLVERPTRFGLIWHLDHMDYHTLWSALAISHDLKTWMLCDRCSLEPLVPRYLDGLCGWYGDTWRPFLVEHSCSNDVFHT